MPCGLEDELLPSKKLRVDSHVPIRFFTGDEVARVCTASNEKCELEILTRELDSLDEDAVFSRTNRRLSVDSVEPSGPIPPLSGLYPFPKRSRSIEHCVYLPAKRQPFDDFTNASSADPVASQPAGDITRPEIAQGARLEASVLQRVAQLKNQGLWSPSRLPKVMEPKQDRSHHEFIVNEILWLAADFSEERKWKKEVAYQLAKAAQTYLVLRQEWNRRCRIMEEHVRFRNAACVSKMVKNWWLEVKQGVTDMGKLAEIHGWSHVAEENKLALSKYSDCAPAWLSQVNYTTLPNSTNSFETLNEFQFQSKGLPSDEESRDDEWLPSTKSDFPNDSESSTRSSRSTSSSRAASFVGDNDENSNSLGITELSSVCNWSKMVPTMGKSDSFVESLEERLTAVQACAGLPDLAITSANDSLFSDGLSAVKSQPSTDADLLSVEEAAPEGIDQTELSALMSESITPLHTVLQLYMDNGWSAPHSMRCGSDCAPLSNIPKSSLSSESTKLPCQPAQMEISTLLSEAELPLDEVVPPGYLEHRTFDVAHSPLEQGLSPGESVNNGTRFATLAASDTSDSSDIKTPDSGTTSASGVQPSVSKFSQQRGCQMTAPPWDNQHCSEPLHHPIDLHEAAASLSSLRSLSLWSDKSVIPLGITGWNPTFRVRSLPSHSLGCAVTWLRQAFLRTVPGLLLTPSYISGDAELVVAAHLGQLTIGEQGSHGYHKLAPAYNVNAAGDWGPHLIVTSRLSLPTWRTRLLTWCPGLKIVCLYHGIKENSGKGRRLRTSVARGVVNICLTTYSALRARPNRYTAIQWSVIVFDQVHNLLQHVGTESVGTQNNRQVVQSRLTNEVIVTSKSDSPTPTEITHGESTRSIRSGQGINVALDLFTSELKCTGHRLLISSFPDLCSSLCGYRLYLLSRLLLLKDPVGSLAYNTWASELFKASTAPHRRRVPHCSTSERPTKRQLNKFIEPFIIRLDEDSEWDAVIEEEIVPCPMTAVQCELHDAVLATKSARNASKSGDLLDLLQTVSLASRICSHPCLTAVQPRFSRRFQSVIQDLNAVGAPYGPFVFRVPSENSTQTETGLIYSTPSAVLGAVRSLRQCDQLEELTGLDLSAVVQQPRYIRERIANLVPTVDQFQHVFNWSERCTGARAPQARGRTHSILLDGHNGISRKNITIQPIADVRNEDLISQIRSKLNSHLTNGLPEPADSSDGYDSLKQLDFTAILVKHKRPRSMSGLPAPESAIQSPKRRRVEDGQDSSKHLNGSTKMSSWTNPFPFLDPKSLVQFQIEFSDGVTSLKSGSSPTDTSSVSKRNYEATERTNVDLSVNGHLNGRTAVSASVLKLTERNRLKCTQHIGVSDWCSLATCELLRFDRRFPCLAPVHSVPPTGRPLTLTEHLQLQLFHELSLWNLSRLYISHLPIQRLLFSCSPVIANTPRPIYSSLQTLDFPVVTHRCHACGYRTSSVYNPDYLTQPSTEELCLSCAINLLYPFTERSRWLSSINSVPTRRVFFNGFVDCGQILLSPCVRLFNESGKFYRLNELLSTILGSRSNLHHNKGRPRCIYLLAHQSALLDLLESFLSASSWRSFPRMRIPCDENAVGSRSILLVDRINRWPRGSCNSLIVLVHSRCPASSLSGLRAGPDTSVVVCDVDWRTDTTDTLRFLFHSWALNGLVDMSKSVTCAGFPRPVLRVYRLVSTGTVNSINPSSSMEACLYRGVACRLLPGAVFHAHSSTIENTSLWSARVQPNVVTELLSCGSLLQLHEPQTPFRSFIKSNELDRELTYPIKPEAPSCSSSSSVASSFSFYTSGPRRGGRQRGEDGETLGFREREPLSEDLLHRAFELFEDPNDVQAWCFGISEASLPMREFTDEYSPLESVDCDIQQHDLDEVVGIPLYPSDSLVGQTNAFVEVPNACDLKSQLNYSDFDSWEVAHYELREYLSSLEERFASDFSTSLAYENVPTEHLSVFDTDEASDVLGFSTYAADQLDTWEPFVFEEVNKPQLPQDSSKLDTTEFNPMTDMQLVSSKYLLNEAFIESQNDFDHTYWGYESEPMSEQDLPPITLSTVTSAPSTYSNSLSGVATLKRSNSNLSSVVNSQNQTDKSVIVTTSPSATRTSSGPSLKRRKLTGGLISRRTIAHPDPVPPTATDEQGVQLPNQGEDSDTSMTPPPGSSTSRSGIGARDGTSLVGSSVVPNSAFSTSTVLSVSSYNNNGIVLTTSHSGGVNTCATRLHIPRANYNKEVGSARNNRLRRLNASSAVCSSAVAAAALAAGAQLPKASSYQHQPSQGTQSTPFPNSTTLGRYSHTSPGRSLHLGLPAPSTLPPRYGVGLQPGVNQISGPGGTVQTSPTVNQLHVGKPLEWLPYEEAALYLCATKIQDVTFDPSNNLSSACPNFHLFEFFMNNYVPARGYRGARQCLLMHSKISNVVSTATAALSNSAFSFPQTVSALGLFTGEDGSLSSCTTPTHNSAASHGPTGRKVKNKLKSAAATAAAITGTASQQGTLGTGAPSAGAINATDSANAVSRYRAYLAYQYLQSCCTSRSGTDGTSNSDSLASTPVQLNQMLSNIRSSDDSHARTIRKAVLDSLLPAHPVPSQPYRSSAARRPLSSGLGSSSHMVSLSSVYPVASGVYSSGSGSSGPIYGHHHGSGGSFPSVQHVGHAPTAPALLTHHRHHRHQTVHDQSSSSTSESGPPTGPSSSLSHTGPIIQKNPTHIAALQEHNINPDTLITPAMVIKNKEEREARLRAEAQSAAHSSAPSATVSSGTIFTTTPSQSNIHAIDTTHPQSTQLSLQLDSNSSGIVTTLPIPITHLPFTHPSNQRGTSVMLPVRCGFGTHSLAPASTVISVAHVGGSQAQTQRILGGSSVSSNLNPQLSHPSKQQVLSPVMGRLTHLGSGSSLDLMGTSSNIHPVSSSNVITSPCADSDGLGAVSTTVSGSGTILGEPGSSNIVLPASWRTSSVSRSFGIQNPRISSLSCNQSSSSTAIPVTSVYPTAQVSKSSLHTSYFLQQRPQFLSTTQASLSTRSILSSNSGVSGNSAMVVGGNYGSSITSLPHILRPRSALRGSVIQPAFVRTITATSTSSVSIVPHQSGPRLSSNSSFSPGRVNLSVSSNNVPVSHLLNSRTALSPAVRTQSSSIFQQLRPSNHNATGPSNAPVTFSFSNNTSGEGRHYISQHQSIPVHQTNMGLPNAFSSTGSADSNGNKLDSESYLTRMQQP